MKKRGRPHHDNKGVNQEDSKEDNKVDNPAVQTVEEDHGDEQPPQAQEAVSVMVDNQKKARQIQYHGDDNYLRFSVK